MNSLDFVLICLIIAMAVVASKRGLARAGFDLFTVALAGGFAPFLGHAYAKGPNEASWTVIFFILIAVCLIAAGIKLFGSSEYFSSGAGALCGAITGLFLCSFVVRVLTISAGPKTLPDSVALSVLGKQFVTFSWYKHTMYALTHFSGS